MLQNGDYVRMLIAPDTRMGTIEGSDLDARGRQHYIFRQDPRSQGIPISDSYLFEQEVEIWPRPGDEHVRAINQLIDAGS